MFEKPIAWSPVGRTPTGMPTIDVADLQVVAAGAEVDDLAAELVAHDGVDGRVEHDGRHRVGRAAVVQLLGQPPALLAVEQQVQVAAADAAGEHLGQHLAGAGVGSGISSTRSCQSRITAARMGRPYAARRAPWSDYDRFMNPPSGTTPTTLSVVTVHHLG